MIQQPDQNQVLAQRFQWLEDRAILASLPLLIVCLLFWAVVSAFPAISTVGNVMITMIVLLISCVVILRLVEVAYGWFKASSAKSTSGDDAMGYMFGTFGIVVLLFAGVIALIDTIIHAGQASGSRAAVVVFLLVILALQYRAIIRRWLGKPSVSEETEKE